MVLVDWYSHSCHIKGASTTNHNNALLFTAALWQPHAAFACAVQVAEVRVYQSSRLRTSILAIPAVPK